MHFVIIGADAAGMSAASRARRTLLDMEITVLEKTADVSYSACGMPYNIADQDRKIEELVVRQARTFREKQAINLLTGHCAEQIDTATKTVSGTDAQGTEFSVTYDKLLIASGASPVIPDLPGFDLPGVMPLKTLEHGRQIKAFIKKHSAQKAVIIGMGYIALEMCEALRKLGITVDMVKPRPVLLPWMPMEMSDIVKNEIISRGAALFAGHAVQKIEPSGDNLKVVCKDLSLEADLVIVAIGVTPNSQIAGEAGLTLGPEKAIAVDRALQTANPHIFAAGDCADAVHVVSNQKTWIPLALRANRAGWAVADNVCGKKTLLDGIAGTAVFKVFDLQVARTGLTASEASKSGFTPVDILVTTRSRAHAHPGSTPIKVHMVGDKPSGRLLGVQMIGREGVAHRINGPAVALHAKMTVEQFSQTDLAYAPPFGPTWDPMLTAANQLLKKM
jgi:NADPH-dependent 2,4-dienoyl-CoA reductase/sulfur reductase-like enzyme